MGTCPFPPALRRRLAWLAGAIVASALATAAQAISLGPVAGLDGLEDDRVLVSGSGALTFSHFRVLAVGEALESRRDLTFAATEHGLRIAGRAEVGDDSFGSLYVSYRVTARRLVEGASLGADLSVLKGEDPAFLKVEERVFSKPDRPGWRDAESLLARLATKTSSGRPGDGDRAALDGRRAFSVLDRIRLVSDDGALVRFSVVNEYRVADVATPEPATALLVLAGLAGLLAARRAPAPAPR